MSEIDILMKRSIKAYCISSNLINILYLVSEYKDEEKMGDNQKLNFPISLFKKKSLIHWTRDRLRLFNLNYLT